MSSKFAEHAPVPGGWYGSELVDQPESWRVRLPGDVADDLFRAAAALPPGDVSADPCRPRPKVSDNTRRLVSELYRRLAGEPGVVVLSGFPVEEPPEWTRRAYLVLGLLLGQPVRQRLDREFLVRIEIAEPDAPGADQAVTPTALPFHIDRATDVIGLLCVRSARTGGLSLLVSSRTVHNVLLERHPDLLSELYEPFPMSVPPLLGPEGVQDERWCEAPVFSRIGEHFAAYCARRVIEYSQNLPGAPQLTRRQRAALDAVDEVTATPGIRLEMALEPGDLQLINNLTVMHSRTAYPGEPSGQGRLLLRLHLAFAGSPQLPAEYTTLYGATDAGTYRGGLWRTKEIQHRFGTPLPAA